MKSADQTIATAYGWELIWHGGALYNIRKPHPNGKENWFEGVAELRCAAETAEFIFTILVIRDGMEKDTRG